MSHRKVLLEMLDEERREIQTRDWAIPSVEEDLAHQREEGFQWHANRTEHTLERHKQKRTRAQLREEALIEALARIPEGE